MISSILQEVLMPVSFGSLLCLMLLYWGQAALFSYTKYSKLTTVLFSFSFISLTTLIILRWVDSGHFPLSNLYESLLFLSWSFLGIQLVAQLMFISAMPEPALLSCVESGRPHAVELPERSSGWPQRGLSLVRPTRISLFKFFEAKPDFALREVSQRQLLHLLGVITSPMALLTYGFAFLNLPREMQKATALVPALQSNWLMMHVTIMILSYAALLCGSILSMVFLLLTNLNTSSPLLQTVYKPTTAGLGPARAERLLAYGEQALAFEFADAPNGNTITERAGGRLVGQLSRAPARLLVSDAEYDRAKGEPRTQAEGYLKDELQLAALPHKELPKLCFSDRLELHDWARGGQTRAGRPGDPLLGASKQPKSKPRFAHSPSALSQQDLALLNSKTRSAGGGLTELWAGMEPKQNLEKAERVLSFAEQAPAAALITPMSLETPYLSLAERLDNYSYRVLALGFPLLTVGILSGAVWANEAWGSYWSWDRKEAWALITWLVFAIYLHARILKGWTGRKPAIIATFGFFVVWFCYLGVNLLGTGLHSYGWFSN